MFTNIVPSGVSLRMVVPRSLSGRERFCATLQVLGFRVVERLLEPLDLGVELGDRALELRDLARSSRRGAPSRSAFAFSVAPVESTWLSREPSRYTVTPLHFMSYASS